MGVIRSVGRSALRALGHTGVAPGLHYRVVERIVPHLAGTELLTARLPNGCRMGCDLRDHVQRFIWFYGAYEFIESYLFSQLVKPGMTVFDVGANVGQYTLLASTLVGPSGQVHSFEPVPRNFERLRIHVAENALTNVTLNQAAAWHEPARLSMALAADKADNAGSFSVHAAGPGASEPIEVAAIRLDDYVAERAIDRVDAIKIDVEGSEPFALAGARQTLLRDRPILLMEVSPSMLERARSNAESLGDELSALGYRIWKIGLSPEASGPVADLTGFTQSNALFHHDDLPPGVTGGWTLKSILRWARGGR